MSTYRDNIFQLLPDTGIFRRSSSADNLGITNLDVLKTLSIFNDQTGGTRTTNNLVIGYNTISLKDTTGVDPVSGAVLTFSTGATNTGLVDFLGSVKVRSNLEILGTFTVQGPVIMTSPTKTEYTDQFVDFNVGYTGTSASSGGFTVSTSGVFATPNYVTSFTAATTTLVLDTSSNTYSAGDLVQISGAKGTSSTETTSLRGNNGIYAVKTWTSGTNTLALDEVSGHPILSTALAANGSPEASTAVVTKINISVVAISDGTALYNNKTATKLVVGSGNTVTTLKSSFVIAGSDVTTLQSSYDNTTAASSFAPISLANSKGFKVDTGSSTGSGIYLAASAASTFTTNTGDITLSNTGIGNLVLNSGSSVVQINSGVSGNVTIGNGSGTNQNITINSSGALNLNTLTGNFTAGYSTHASGNFAANKTADLFSLGGPVVINIGDKTTATSGTTDIYLSAQKLHYKGLQVNDGATTATVAIGDVVYYGSSGWTKSDGNTTTSNGGTATTALPIIAIAATATTGGANFSYVDRHTEVVDVTRSSGDTATRVLGMPVFMESSTSTRNGTWTSVMPTSSGSRAIRLGHLVNTTATSGSLHKIKLSIQHIADF